MLQSRTYGSFDKKSNCEVIITIYNLPYFPIFWLSSESIWQRNPKKILSIFASKLYGVTLRVLHLRNITNQYFGERCFISPFIVLPLPSFQLYLKKDCDYCELHIYHADTFIYHSMNQQETASCEFFHVHHVYSQFHSKCQFPIFRMENSRKVNVIQKGFWSEDHQKTQTSKQ